MDLTEKKIFKIYFMLCLVVAAIIGFIAIYILEMDLTDNKTFQTLFVFCAVVMVAITILACRILKKYGVDIYLPKNMVMIGLLPAASIGFVPIWLHPLVSLSFKVGLAVFAGTLSIANFYAVHYGGKKLRKQIGIENEEDRWEKEREEKATKEKEAKGKGE